ncbi:hypothetical protein [Methanolapillus millepedarum]|uniref:Uncharacterized protein n=1 Tax=Methanolapillus millepedarum TaxID=3028296 RepID=A0AA96VAM9_9EURY|nr:hypothetical protein MsAc7_01080 [Methanosarcinaceae archaeon Ac7]
MYLPNSYICVNYATDLANNSEAAGIKCGIIVLCFKEGGTHMLNAYRLTDGRTMYVETTGSEGFAGSDIFFFELKEGDIYLDGTVHRIYTFW